MRRLLPLAALLSACSSDKPADGSSVALSGAPSTNAPASASASASQAPAGPKGAGVPLPAHLFTGSTASHACFVSERKRLFCWGRNDEGQLGPDGKKPTEHVPVEWKLGGPVRSAALGEKHTCALLEDGSAHCVGVDASGVRRGADAIGGLGDVTSLVAGGDFTCASSGDESVRCWGRIPGKAAPLRDATVVEGLTGSKLAASTGTLCAITPTGPKCLGDNPGGRIAMGGPSSLASPTAIDGVKGSSQIALTDLGLCVRDGERLGCYADKADPAIDVFGAEDLSAGVDGIVCTRRSSDILCEQLPYGAWVRFRTEGSFREIGVGRGFVCALPTKPHEVPSCWGDNEWGQLGAPAPKARFSATELAPLKGATRIAAGSASVCALMPDKKIRCLGENGQTSQQWTPNGTYDTPLGDDAANMITRADDMTVGGGIRCALTDGLPTCWGDNTSNQIITVNPGIIEVPSTFASLGKLSKLVFGPSHACSLSPDDEVRCWGGPGKERKAPTKVKDLVGVLDLAVGGDRGCALLEDGTVSCFLLNGEHAFEARRVDGAKGFTSIVAGGRHYCGVTARHEVSCFGANDRGQLARPRDASDGERAATVPKLDHVKAVTLGETFACALVDDGAVRCFGSADDGELGRDEKSPALEPVTIAGLSKVAQIAASAHAMTARLDDGRVLAWGGRSFFAKVGDDVERSDAPRTVATRGLTEEAP